MQCQTKQPLNRHTKTEANDNEGCADNSIFDVRCVVIAAQRVVTSGSVARIITQSPQSFERSLCKLTIRVCSVRAKQNVSVVSEWTNNLQQLHLNNN